MENLQNLPCGKEDNDIFAVTPEETREKVPVEGEAENVLRENKIGHQNIVARRNNKEEGKKVTPPNVKVPSKKIFGFPERYRSPTDSIMSPTTRGLLARNKRSMRPIELPAYVPPKSVENTVPSAGPAAM